MRPAGTGEPVYQPGLLGFADVTFPDRKRAREHRRFYRLLARPPGPVRKFVRKVRANPVAAGGVAAFALAAAAVVVVLLRPAPPPSERIIVNPPPPPPPAGTEAERAWNDAFLPCQAELAYHNFKDVTPQRIAEIRRVLASMPPSLRPNVAGWFLGQAVLLPGELWAKKEWMEKRDEAAARRYSNEQKTVQFDEIREKRFRENPAAWEFFQAQPAGYRRVMTHRVMSAKREETREKRLDQLVAVSARGRRVDLLKPEW